MVTSFCSLASVPEIPRAYRVVAERFGVPVDVFFAINLQESAWAPKGSGKHYLPWPWTLNIDNQAFYYKTRYEAEKALITAVYDAKAVGKTAKVAIGLGQIYLPSHAHKFVSPLLVLDPTVNLHYAGQLLAEQYVWTVRQGKPDWWVAVGRYHSPSNSVLADEYRQRVFQRCVKFSGQCASYGGTKL